MRIRYITHACSEARKWAALMCNPAFSGVPNKGDKIQNGFIAPAFSGA